MRGVGFYTCKKIGVLPPALELVSIRSFLVWKQGTLLAGFAHILSRGVLRRNWSTWYLLKTDRTLGTPLLHDTNSVLL
jgi:hypothetical protein